MWACLEIRGRVCEHGGSRAADYLCLTVVCALGDGVFSKYVATLNESLELYDTSLSFGFNLLSLSLTVGRESRLAVSELGSCSQPGHGVRCIVVFTAALTSISSLFPKLK